MSAAQIDRVAKQLATATPRQLRVVVVRQPAAVTQARDRTNLLCGHSATQLIERWDFAGGDRGFVRTAVTSVQPERV